MTLTITIVGNNGTSSFSPNPGSIVAGQTVAFRPTMVGTLNVTALAGY